MDPTLVRIAHTDNADFRDVTDGKARSHEGYAQLQRVIRAHLPGVTASLLALATPVADGIDWYTDLSGESIRLTDLELGAQAPVRDVLAKRRAAIERLADELSILAPADAAFTQALRAAAQYPDETCVYVVGGQPVVIWWGHLSRADARRYLGAQGPRPGVGGAAGRQNLRIWLSVLLVTVLAAVGVGTWALLDHRRAADLQEGLDSVIADECRSPALLAVLLDRLTRVDPQREHYPDLWSRTLAQQQQCEIGLHLAAKLGEAGDNCQALAILRTEVELHETTRQPIKGLRQELESKLAECRNAERLRARLTQARGDCAAITELQRALEIGPNLGAEKAAVLAAIDEEAMLCAEASGLSAALQAAHGQCRRLRELAGEIKRLDILRPQLRELVQRLHAELSACDQADTVSTRIDAAQMDCAALARIGGEPGFADARGEPMAAVRLRHDALRAVCASIDELETQFKRVRLDCQALQVFAPKVAERPRDNPRIAALLERTNAEVTVCERSRLLTEKIPQQLRNCDGLTEIEREVAAAPADDPRFDAPRSALAAQRPLCLELQRLTAEESRIGGACDPTKDLRRRIDRNQAKAPQFKELVARLEQRIAACTRLAERCPGTRKVVPEMAIVFDASASMGNVLGTTQTDPRGYTNIDVAKKATREIVSQAPMDVNIGLVEVADCAGARTRGKYTAAQRGALTSTIEAIRTGAGTPLAAGLVAAGNLVDGRTSPAVIVVISDGVDSCGHDPCQVLAQLARERPKLIINVVDIGGAGAANCATAETGGKVYTVTTAAELRDTLRSAAQEIQGPADCPGH